MKTSGHLPYYAESMFPKMEMDEHRADRQQLEARMPNWKNNWPITRRKAAATARILENEITIDP